MSLSKPKIGVIIAISLTITGILLYGDVLPYWQETKAYTLEECFDTQQPLPYNVNCYKVCTYYLHDIVCNDKLVGLR